MSDMPEKPAKKPARKKAMPKPGVEARRLASENELPPGKATHNRRVSGQPARQKRKQTEPGRRLDGTGQSGVPPPPSR